MKKIYLRSLYWLDMNQPVVCKFRLTEIKKSSQMEHEDNDYSKPIVEKVTASLRFEPVVDGSPENKSFFRWTPSGRIEFDTVNGDAVKGIEAQKEYYVIFTDNLASVIGKPSE